MVKDHASDCTCRVCRALEHALDQQERGRESMRRDVLELLNSLKEDTTLTYVIEQVKKLT